MSERDSYGGKGPGEPVTKPRLRGEIRLDPELYEAFVDLGFVLAGVAMVNQALLKRDFGEARRLSKIVEDRLELREIQRRERRATLRSSQPNQPNLPNSLQVEPSLSPGQDIHQPEYYHGNRGSGPVLPPSLQTRPGPGDIHPPGYHTGGPGPYIPPQFRTGPGPFGK